MEYEKNVRGKIYPKFIFLQPILWLFKKLNMFIKKNGMKNIKDKKSNPTITHIKKLIISLIFKGYVMGFAHINK